MLDVLTVDLLVSICNGDNYAKWTETCVWANFEKVWYLDSIFIWRSYSEIKHTVVLAVKSDEASCCHLGKFLSKGIASISWTSNFQSGFIFRRNIKMHRHSLVIMAVFCVSVTDLRVCIKQILQESMNLNLAISLWDTYSNFSSRNIFLYQNFIVPFECFIKSCLDILALFDERHAIWVVLLWWLYDQWNLLFNLANVILLQKLILWASNIIGFNERLGHPFARVNVVHWSWRAQIWNIKHVECNTTVSSTVEAVKMGHNAVNSQGILNVLEGIRLRHKVILAFDGSQEHFFREFSLLIYIDENPFWFIFSFHRRSDKAEKVIKHLLIAAIKRILSQVLAQVHVILASSTAGYVHNPIFRAVRLILQD